MVGEERVSVFTSTACISVAIDEHDRGLIDMTVTDDDTPADIRIPMSEAVARRLAAALIEHADSAATAALGGAS